MEKDKPEFEVKVKIWGKKDGSSQKIYFWEETVAQKIKTDEGFYSTAIAKSLAKMKFFIPIEILLGSYHPTPLFIVVKKIGNLSFSEGNLESIQLFNGDETALRETTTKKIQMEFRNKLFEFLKKKWKAKFSQAISHRKELSKLIDESSKIGDLCARF